MSYNATKIIPFNGINIKVVITNNTVLWCSNWELIYDLKDAGYFTIKFYKNLYGHTEFVATQKLIDLDPEQWIYDAELRANGINI